MTPEQLVSEGQNVGTQTGASPQSEVPTNSLPGQNAQGIQSGTATSVLTNDSGVALNTANVTGVALGASSSSSMGVNTTPAQGPNPLFVGFSVILFIAAAILFISIWRSEKNTTI